MKLQEKFRHIRPINDLYWAVVNRGAHHMGFPSRIKDIFRWRHLPQGIDVVVITFKSPGTIASLPPPPIPAILNGASDPRRQGHHAINHRHASICSRKYPRCACWVAFDLPRYFLSRESKAQRPCPWLSVFSIAIWLYHGARARISNLGYAV